MLHVVAAGHADAEAERDEHAAQRAYRESTHSGVR
jgi:hypothetical protein